MKNFIKSIIIVASFAMISTSCSDSDLLIDQVLETVDTEGGVIMRVIQAPSDFFLNVDPNPDDDIYLDQISYTIEIQKGNGTIDPELKEVRLFFTLYLDAALENPILNDLGEPVGEILFATNDASLFEIGSNGVPRIEFVDTVSNFVSLIPTNAEIIPGFPHTIAFRYEFETLDGRVYKGTSDELGINVSSVAYFNSRHNFRSTWINN